MLSPSFFLLGHLVGDLLGFPFPVRVLLLHKTLDVLHVALPLLVLLLDDLFQSVAVVLEGKGDVTFKSEKAKKQNHLKLFLHLFQPLLAFSLHGFVLFDHGVPDVLAVLQHVEEDLFQLGGEAAHLLDPPLRLLKDQHLEACLPSVLQEFCSHITENLATLESLSAHS